PIALKLSNQLPLPNVPGSTITSNYNGSGKYHFGRERADTKLNWNPTAKITSFGRFSMLNYSMYSPAVFGPIGGNGTNANSAGGGSGNTWGQTYSVTIGSTYLITPRLILDGYFAWEDDNNQIEPDDSDKQVGLMLGIPGANGPNRYQG